MLRYVPGFILNRAAVQKDSGSFTGFVLFADIAGFTDLSNVFRKEGKKGAEALNHYLSSALASPIGTVEKYGGFISHFAGDAFCAVFPDADASRVKHVVSAIQQYMDDIKICKTEIGDFPVKLRITVSMGKLDWQVFRNEIQCEYVFSGKPLQELAALSAKKKELTLSDAVAVAFDAVGEAEPMPSPLDCKATDAELSPFTNARIVNDKPDNEIRDGAYCFVNLARVKKNQVGKALALMHAKLDNYGGFLNKLDDGDKGLVALVLFGLPKALGNTLERACRFALETIAEIPELSLGLSCGTAYAGFVGSDTTREYTSLGAAVNLASRLMQKAGKGEILTDSYLEQELHYKYRFEPAETVTLKGFAAAVHCHRLSDRLPAPPQSFLTELMGRETELELIRQAVETAGSRIMYISGEPGIGKSRLILEALKQYPKRYFLFCDPSGHKLLEPIKQFLRQYFSYDPLLSREQNQKSFRAQWEALAGEDKELQRIESIVGDLLGYEWEGSIWSMLPPNERPEQQRKAFATLLARIAETERIIIHLDDPQWLDATDTEYFRQLGTARLEGIVIIAACRYLEDGNKVDLEIPNWEARHLDLNRLSEDAAARLIRHLLKVEALPPETQDWIVKKADGNPLFIEQVVAYLRENGCFDQDYRLKGNLDYLSSFGIADIIGSRIDSLTEHVRNTLQHACVLGLEFNTRVLSEMLSRKLDDDLGEGKQARVWADIDELRYIFTHVLIKDTAYNRMLSDKLKKLHLLAAETMEALLYINDGTHAEEIAVHFDRAGSFDEAIKYYTKAGDFYTNTYVFNRAQVCLSRALTLTTELHGETSEQAGDIIMSMGNMCTEMSDFNSAKLYVAKAVEIFLQTIGQANKKYIVALIRLAFLMEELSDFQHTLDFMEQAKELSLAVFGECHEVTVKVYYNLSNHYIRTGNDQQALELLIKVVELDKVLRSTDTILGSKHLNDLAVCYANLGQLVKAKEHFAEAYNIMLKIKGKEGPYTTRILRNLGKIAYHEGNLKTAANIHLQCINIIEPILGTQHSDTCDAYVSYANDITDLGQSKDAIMLMNKVVEIQKNLNRRLQVASSLHNLGNIYSYMEERESKEKGIACYKESLLIKESVWKGDHRNIALTLESLGNVYYMIGDFDTAIDQYKLANDMSRRLYGDKSHWVAKSENRMADVLGELGRYDESIEHFKSALSIFEDTVDRDSVLLLPVLINYGSTLDIIGEHRAAINHLSRGFDIIMSTDAGRDHEYFNVVVKGLRSCYESSGEYEKAAEYRAMLIAPKS